MCRLFSCIPVLKVFIFKKKVSRDEGSDFYYDPCPELLHYTLLTGLQGKGEGISSTHHYHSDTLHRHLDINRTITAESSSLQIGSSRTRTGNLWFPSPSY